MSDRNVRIRREIRSLTPDEWQNVVKAFSVMKTTSLKEGRRLYGPNFITYDMMVEKHAHAALDRRGDQAHWGPIFPIFHRYVVR